MKKLYFNQEDYMNITINIMQKINSSSALTRDQGKIIYDEIINNFQNGNHVTLDFSNIESLITPFLNVAIGKLYEAYSSEEIKKHLQLENIPAGKSSSINLVISNAKRYYSDHTAFENNVKELVGE